MNPGLPLCELHYTVHATVGGKIAQLGQRLIDGAAKTMAEDFFKRFDNEMQRRYPREAAGEETQDTVMSHAPAQPIALPTDSQASGGMPVWGWIAIGAAALAVVAWLMS